MLSFLAAVNEQVPAAAAEHCVRTAMSLKAFVTGPNKSKQPGGPSHGR